jgi:hypothetical protein
MLALFVQPLLVRESSRPLNVRWLGVASFMGTCSGRDRPRSERACWGREIETSGAGVIYTQGRGLQPSDSFVVVALGVVRPVWVGCFETMG